MQEPVIVKKASVATDFRLTTTRAPEMTHLPSHGMWEGEIRYVEAVLEDVDGR